jgi:carboxyl-terminal processing protease
MMLRITLLMFSLAAAAVIPRFAAAQDVTPAQLLEKAIYQEQTVGDLPNALSLYRRIVDQHKKNEGIAAQAQLHIGLIHLKQGQHGRAAAVIRDLADQYPEQKRLVQQSRRVAPQPVLDETIERIRTNYVDEFDDDSELTEAVLRGVLGNLDAHSAYMDAQSLRELRINTSGKLVGIGAVMDAVDGRLVVKTPLPGSPAREAGLQAADTIVSIDGVKVPEIDEEYSIGEAIKGIRGKPGDVVTVEVVSADSDRTRRIEITRREIKLASVSGTERDQNDVWHYRLKDHSDIGYLRIRGFTEQTAAEFRRVVTRMHSEGIKGLVIDLRNCGGGLMTATIEVADMFLTEGVILDVRGRNSEMKTFSAGEDEILNGLPVAILVNRNTASAAEILAGALRDRERAIVIGERTFGKGTVQSLFQLNSGGAIKLTTARFYLPGGSSLEKPMNPGENDSWGVDPSEGFAVETSDEQLKAYADYRSAVEMFGRPGESAEAFDDTALDKAAEYIEDQQSKKESFETQ